jgi:hypothetical protein
MKTLQRLAERPSVPAATAWYLAELGEARGKQELFTEQSPEKLKMLREHAIIESSRGWHEGRHDLWPYTNYLLSILSTAYRKLEARVGEIRSPRGAKTERVIEAIGNTIGPFRVADLQAACGGVSLDTIRRALRELRGRGKVECLGKGQTAEWRKTGS